MTGRVYLIDHGHNRSSLRAIIKRLDGHSWLVVNLEIDTGSSYLVTSPNDALEHWDDLSVFPDANVRRLA